MLNWYGVWPEHSPAGGIARADNWRHDMGMDVRNGPARRSLVILLVILMAGTALRTVGLRAEPPGLNQDEAANAWNAYCLLRTGQDQTGAHWPIFYSRCLGENRSTLYLYYLLPFQAIGGLDIWTLRFASAFSGVAAILVIYYVGARLFGRPAGLIAAGILAVTPWAVQQSRWGHEAAIVPLLMLLTVAAWLWAGLPFSDSTSTRARPWRAALAGLLTGACCYGYPAIRIVMPLFGLLAVAFTWRAWWRWLHLPRGGYAAGAFLLGLAVTFGPLLWMHLQHPEIMNKRFAQTCVWAESDSFWGKVGAVMARYPGHFGFEFLFFRGDVNEHQSPPVSGVFHAYLLPLMLIGAVAGMWRWGELMAGRLLAAWLLAYPFGDCLSWHLLGGMHAMRSLPGLPALVLLGAAGAVQAAVWLQRWPSARRLCALGIVLIAVALNVQTWLVYFGSFYDRPEIRRYFYPDLVEATEWLRPRFDQYDAVFCTTERFNMPYVVTLVALDYDPRQWFTDPRALHEGIEWDLYTRYGKMRFVFDDHWEELDALRADGRPDHVAFIITPNEARQARLTGLRPTHIIRSTTGFELLWICEAVL